MNVNAASNLQLDANGRLRHFLTIEGLGRQTLVDILNATESFAGVSDRTVKKVPVLRCKVIIYTYVPQHREHANDQKIIVSNEVQTKNMSSRSSQVDEHELTPLVIKPTRPVDIEKITDNLLPVIASAASGSK